MTPSTVKIQSLEALASLVRSGHCIRSALEHWKDEGPHGSRADLGKVSARLRLGDTTVRALEPLRPVFGPDHGPLTTIVDLASALGGDVSAMLDRLARVIERRDTFTAAGRSASAGAVLSARMVAGLPLAFLPLTPAVRAPLFDPIGILLLVAGIALAGGGMWWIHRVVPRPSSADDPAASAAEITATLLDGGLSLSSCLHRVAAADAVEGSGELGRASRMVSLGASWPRALSLISEEGFRELGTTIERAGHMGLPVGDVLVALASRRRERIQHDFEAATKKAPVAMVVPLVLCVLPSFGLLALAPFLRGLAGAV